MSSSRSIRALHCSTRVLKSPPRRSMSIDSLRTPAAPAGRFDAASAVKSVISALEKSRLDEEEEPQRKFVADRLLHPEQLHVREANAPRRPSARSPLLGPPKHLAKLIDPYLLAGAKPMDHIYNPSFMGAYLNSLGRLRPRSQTGLTWRSQKAVGRAVKRARCMGIISYWSDSPPLGGFGPPLAGKR